MEYKLDEQAIINWALNRLPDVNIFDKKLAVVYINDFIGETDIIAQNRYSEIYLPNGELMLLDKKEKNYYYYVIFQKIKEKGKWIWDLVGYDKQEIFSFNVR
jgi:hypothetical protein